MDKCFCGRDAATEAENAEAHAKRMCKGCFDINQYVSVRYSSHKAAHEVEASQAEVHFMPIAQLQS
jgi:hypothetical protein